MLDHPSIVPVYESGSVGTVSYIASAYCPGPTLAEWLAARADHVPVRDAVGLVATLARAVEHAHERGVLHRDLKPGNVLLQRTETDEDDRALAAFQPRITDFSLAWLADGEGPRTRSGIPLGSPPYMAPEQAEGRLGAIGPATDVYGLGCILYELLVEYPPFRGESQLDTLRQVIADEPAPPRRERKEIPRPLEAVVLKCLAKDPTRRYLTAGELADDLDRFLAGEPILRPASSAGGAGLASGAAPSRGGRDPDARTDFRGDASGRPVLVRVPAGRNATGRCPAPGSGPRSRSGRAAGSVRGRSPSSARLDPDPSNARRPGVAPPSSPWPRRGGPARVHLVSPLTAMRSRSPDTPGSSGRCLLRRVLTAWRPARQRRQGWDGPDLGYHPLATGPKDRSLPDRGQRRDVFARWDDPRHRRRRGQAQALGRRHGPVPAGEGRPQRSRRDRPVLTRWSNDRHRRQD